MTSRITTKINVVVVGPDEVEREGLSRLLQGASFNIVGSYCDDHDLRAGASMVNRGVILIDTPHPDAMLDACRSARELWPSWKIVVFASACHGDMVVEAFDQGIDGYIEKTISVVGLGEILKLVWLGEKILPSQVLLELTRSSSKRFDEAPGMGGQVGADLSDRELNILEGLIRGDPNKVISRDLLISEGTVKVHVKSILRKLGVRNRTEAAIWGMTRSLNPAAEHRTDSARRSLPSPLWASVAGTMGSTRGAY